MGNYTCANCRLPDFRSFIALVYFIGLLHLPLSTFPFTKVYSFYNQITSSTNYVLIFRNWSGKPH
ncbi:hypothetical protein EPI10_019594 [Gossypium australe]|uniref:Uncharacterized protein n=1 Tax=Gossypium australe TaxID=47621 RepID=A0A5B6WD14_9ROSI|nr:hypothetical protein EPI10_019594 [Gossypium australe]